jgi:glycine C-acetyltransferase
MPNARFDDRCRQLLATLEETRQKKRFLYLEGPMGPTVRIEGLGEVVVLCSNNYLGMASDPDVVRAGIQGLERYGAGTASVRFICGSLRCHRELEETIAWFVGAESALSYVSCWTANEAVFPTLCGPEDVILSDELNHASIIDSCRLAGRITPRGVYRHSDLEDLERQLKEHAGKACRWVVTDGVFSMEGDVCRLPELIDKPCWWWTTRTGSACWEQAAAARRSTLTVSATWTF